MFTRLTGKEEGLVAYWNFDEGNGNRFRNLAGDRYHGYLGGNSPLRTDVPKWVPSNGSLGQPGFDVKKAPIQY